MPEYIEREAFIKRLENEADKSSDIINLLILNGIANIVRDENIAPAADVIDAFKCKECERIKCELCSYKQWIEELTRQRTYSIPNKLYHVTTPKKAKRYHESGCIYKPVRGFTTLQAALAWAVKTGRTVIYEINGDIPYRLPDHHNKFGEAWYFNENISIENIECVFSAEKDA